MPPKVVTNASQTGRAALFPLGLWVALVVFVAAMALVVSLFSRLSAANDWLMHSYNVIQQVDRCDSALQAVQTSVHGYVGTAEKFMLRSYHSDVDQVLFYLKQIRQLTRDNPGQERLAADLEASARLRIACADATIGLQSGQYAGLMSDELRASVREGIDEMERFSAIRRRLIQQEQAELVRRDHEMMNAQIRAGGAIAFLCMLAIALVAWSYRELAVLYARLKAVGEELVQASQAKDRFFMNMSHELRTPLHSILSFAELLRLEQFGALTADQKRQITVMESSGKHLLSLIEDMLNLAKIESGNFKLVLSTVKANRVVFETVETLKPLAQSKQILLDAVPFDDDALVVADERALQQILFNLIGNAIKFTDHGRIDVCLKRQGRSILFEVRDTGIGISPDDQGKLFKSVIQFQTARRQDGTGLGLYLSQRLAVLMHGGISVESTPAAGSTFTLTLGEPAFEATQAHIVQPA